MFYVIKHLYCLLQDVYERNADPRVKHLPFVYAPLPVIITIPVYLAFVLHYGPKWMEKRKPFNLKYIMLIYNAVQVIANSILFLFAFPYTITEKNYSLTCQPIDSSNREPWMIRLLYISYGYYLTKYLDLFDTIFIVLRKRNQQITFLHVYHHAGILFGAYVHMSFMAGSHATMLGVINLLVHSVMYTYYFLTSLKSVKEKLWWKRYITQMQLVQFGYLTIHFGIVLFQDNCHYSKLVTMVGFVQNIFMFALFFEFYYRAYIKKSVALLQPAHQMKYTANRE